MSKNTFSAGICMSTELLFKRTQHRSSIPFQHVFPTEQHTHTHWCYTLSQKKPSTSKQFTNSKSNKFGHLRVFTPRTFWGFQPVSTPFLAVQKTPVFPQRAVLPGETKPLKVLPWPSWGEFIDGIRIGFSPWKSTIVRLPISIDFQTI